MDRSSGILLPVSALPGPCGIGDLGADARDFIDFLTSAYLFVCSRYHHDTSCHHHTAYQRKNISKLL